MSHDLTSLSVLSRLFDFLFAYSPAMIAYFAVAVRPSSSGRAAVPF